LKQRSTVAKRPRASSTDMALRDCTTVFRSPRRAAQRFCKADAEYHNAHSLRLLGVGQVSGRPHVRPAWGILDSATQPPPLQFRRSGLVAQYSHATRVFEGAVIGQVTLSHLTSAEVLAKRDSGNAESNIPTICRTSTQPHSEHHPPVQFNSKCLIARRHNSCSRAAS
jgi:hypothetical protein